VAQVSHEERRLILIVQDEDVGMRMVGGRSHYHSILAAYQAAQVKAEFAPPGRIVSRAAGIGWLIGGQQAGAQGLQFGVEAV